MSAILTSGVAADVIISLLEYARAAAVAIRVRVAVVVDVALAAVDVAGTVFVMNEGGRFHRRHCWPKPAVTSPSSWAAAAATPAWPTRSWPPPLHPLSGHQRAGDRTRPQGRLPPVHRRVAPVRLPRPATTSDPRVRPGLRHPTADPGEPTAPRPPGQDAGEWEISRIPLQYGRAVLAGAVVREKLHATVAAVRGRAYDVVAHQQAAMPEQLLAPEPADPEHDDQEQKPSRREALDMTLRALRESRTDVEALDVTAERLRHLQDAFNENPCLRRCRERQCRPGGKGT